MSLRLLGYCLCVICLLLFVEGCLVIDAVWMFVNLGFACAYCLL